MKEINWFGVRLAKGLAVILTVSLVIFCMLMPMYFFGNDTNSDNWIGWLLVIIDVVAVSVFFGHLIEES